MSTTKPPTSTNKPQRSQALEAFAPISKGRTGLVRQSSLRKPGKFCLKKSVSFDERPPDTKPIEHVTAIPKREIKQRWLSSRDFQKLQSDALVTLHQSDNPDEIRGLERQTEMGMCQYQDIHRDAVMAVLQQQDMLWQTSQWDDEAAPQLIAKAYREETKYSQQIAAQMGQRDEEEVEEYLADCTLDLILKEQKHYSKNQTFMKRVLVKPAQKLTRSLSFKSVMNPQA